MAALDESASAKGILRSIVKLGHGLGMTVTAEGIESARQLASLRELGCDLAQGYLLGQARARRTNLPPSSCAISPSTWAAGRASACARAATAERG